MGMDIRTLLNKSKWLCLLALLFCVCAKLPENYCGDNNHFDPNTHFCFNDSETIERCGVNKLDYDPINQFCDGGNVHGRCDSGEWDEWLVTTVATCNAPGVERRNCNTGSGYETRPKAPLCVNGILENVQGSLIGWNNPFSSQSVVNTSAYPSNITLNASNSLVVTPLSAADGSAAWDLQLAQGGFNHVAGSQNAVVYEVTIAGYTTGGPVNFALTVQRDGTINGGNWSVYCFVNIDGIVNGNGFVTVDGNFERTFSLLQSDDLDSDPHARFAINFAFPENGILTITTLSIRGL